MFQALDNPKKGILDLLASSMGGGNSGGPLNLPGINPMAGAVGAVADKATKSVRMAAGGKKDKGWLTKFRDISEAVEAWQMNDVPVGQTLRQMREGRAAATAQQEAAKANAMWEMQKLLFEQDQMNYRSRMSQEGQMKRTEATNKAQMEQVQYRQGQIGKRAEDAFARNNQARVHFNAVMAVYDEKGIQATIEESKGTEEGRQNAMRLRAEQAYILENYKRGRIAKSDSAGVDNILNMNPMEMWKQMIMNRGGGQ